MDYDLEKIVRLSAKSALMPQTRQRETMDRWEKQFAWYDGGILKRDELRSRDVMETLKIIRDLNPDASMAVWNFLRLANSGHELEVLTPNGRVEQRATDYCNEIARTVGKLYGGGLDQLINVMLLTGFTQGAIALEVELNDSLSEVVDFHPVDPSTLDFRRNKETNEMELVQKQSTGEYKVLNQETVFYFPFDPDISDPYGRSPILPVLQIIFFQVEVLKDLKKVIHHQGHQRFDIKVMEQAIIDNMPDEIKHQGPEAVRNFVMSYVQDIQTQMDLLEPDDDFFHTDSIEIDMAGGSIGGSLDATRVIDIINQQVVTSLKQLPILLGRNEGTTETHGTIQWQIYVKGIESLQRGIKRLLERAYNVSLQIGGYQGKAKLEFNPLRVTDRLKDAQAEEVETRTKIQHVNQGWISNDEAAVDVVGHEAVSEPIAPINPSPVSAALRKYPKKKRSDEIIVNTDHDFADDLEDLTDDARKAFYRFIKDQRDLYLERLKDAPDLPTSVLVEARSLRNIQKGFLNIQKGFLNREETPSPPVQFKNWVNTYVLNDSEAQMELWVHEGRGWMENAAVLAGMATLLELEIDMEFNERDERLLRWLSERSRRSAQLIQGVTDEGVLMTLWDVVIEGHFSIAKASQALRESYNFSQHRAEVISRTEIISAGRAGQFHGDQQSGIVIGKRWMAAHQERTREGHREADGQVVAFDEPFYVANGKGQVEPLMFPGDSSLGAGPSNTIQCRCFYERILEGEELK